MKKNLSMKKIMLVISIVLVCMGSKAQINATISINTNVDRHPISPLIYGSNGQGADQDENITARRFGGNRLSGYNWENNASHAGTDWYNSNDNYLPWVMGLPANMDETPNAVYKAFQDTSLQMNCYSLITLPMAGNVSHDKNGEVFANETAPSARFKEVVNQKGSVFSLTPDTSDNFIYIDECLHNLIDEYGLSTTGTGIKAYSMDNEYALWISTHPRIHPQQPTITEVISKSSNLARTIKTMDAGAEVYGPADYGYASFLNFQSAPDWNSYAVYGNFINAYLNGLKLASDTFGSRLLDVVDVHWYPEAQGINNNGVLERVVGGSNDRNVAIARMQCPRTLWDSSYTENSWIGQWFSPCVYIHALQNGIATYYPGTKLAFTEFNYGGQDHISGGIAIADVLGIFGRYGVYMSTHWGSLDEYVSTGFKIFRNYDGNNSTFGDISVQSLTSDIENSSAYASLESTDTSRLHLIAMNKNYDSTLVTDFNISGNNSFDVAEVWKFNSTSMAITGAGNVAITNNHFTYPLDPLSVYHFIFKNTATAISIPGKDNIVISPNPFEKNLYISNLPSGQRSKIEITDAMGNVIRQENTQSEKLQIETTSLSTGIYFIKITSQDKTVVRRAARQ
ncbi:MAG: glycoside hydrolase family 44 protein [Bacteroidota bacterium]